MMHNCVRGVSTVHCATKKWTSLDTNPLVYLPKIGRIKKPGLTIRPYYFWFEGLFTGWSASGGSQRVRDSGIVQSERPGLTQQILVQPQGTRLRQKLLVFSCG